MKIILIKDRNNKTCGWDLQAESTEDRLILGAIRNFQFFGTGDQVIKYDGMNTWSEDDNYIDTVKYRTVKEINAAKTTLFKRLESESKDIPNTNYGVDKM